jgi:hypothetical protein
VTPYIRDLDIAQGYAITPGGQNPVGHIVGWKIGETTIAADIAAVDPVAGGLPRQVVAVLSHVAWSMLPNEDITLRTRVSPANAQRLRTLVPPYWPATMFILFAVYEHGQVYYPSLSSHVGVAPNGAPTPLPGGSGGFGSSAIGSVYAMLAHATSLTVAAAPATDPPGIMNYAVDVTMSAPIASSPQQFRLQTSATAKTIQPWGIPQS